MEMKKVNQDQFLKSNRIKKKCILHIGMHKTGSSSIQESLCKNLVDDNFHYIKLNSPNHSGDLEMLFRRDPNDNFMIRSLELDEDIVLKNKKAIQNIIIDEVSDQHMSYILSGESVVTLSTNELKDMYYFLSSIFERIIIVAYIRPPKGFIESAFQQRLKGTHINTISEAVPAYRERFEKFDEVFGEDNVIFWKFDPTFFPNGDVVLDFCKRLNIFFDKKKSIKVNESLSLEAISLLYVYRKYGPPYGRGKSVHAEMDFIVQKLSQIGSEKFKVSYDTILPILEKNKDDIEWMQQRLGECLNEQIIDQPGSIQCEEDLEKIALESVKSLVPVIDSYFIPYNIDINTIEGIVAMVHSLRLMAKEKILSNEAKVNLGKGDNKKELCIIHIGMPKTGSSTLQEAFFAGLNDERVSYAQLDFFNQGLALYGIFMDKPEEFHFFASQNWSASEFVSFVERNKKILLSNFQNKEHSIEILSGEDLFHFSEIAIQRLKKFLDLYFKKILVVGYVRPLKSFLESAFQQLVKYHEQGDLNYRNIYHRYKNFERYDKVFGSENVKLFKFNPAEFPEGDIVLDFCQRLSLKPTKSQLKVVNESLTKEAVSILFTYHFHFDAKSDFGDKKHLVQTHLVELIRQIGNEKFRFSQHFMEVVLEEFNDDYDWIQSRLGERLDERVDFMNKDGISTSGELMFYATNYIDDLVELADGTPIPFELVKHPQTVAKLVNILANKIYRNLI